MTPPRLLDLVLFDIAGTLIADTDRTTAAYQAVLDEVGLPMNAAWIRDHIGCAKRSVFEELLRQHDQSPELAEALADRFAHHIESSFESRPPEVFPTVEPMFRFLRGCSVRIGLITGFDASTAECIRSLADWSLDVIVGSDEVATGRPAPDLVQEAMRRVGVEDVRSVASVGDTPRDLMMGAAAGCGWNIAVASGSYRREELECHPHTHVLDSLQMLPGVINH